MTTMMSSLFADKIGETIELQGWVGAIRIHKNVVFIDLVDSAGSVQVVFSDNYLASKSLETVKTDITNEIGIELRVKVRDNSGAVEFAAVDYKIYNKPSLKLSPRPRSDFDIFQEDLSNHIFSHYHIYMRNPKFIALMKFRSELKRIVRRWFESREYVEFDAPILTPSPLYSSDTALDINVRGNNLFLTQCAGFYLEAAAQALDKVYNLGPSFRGENSRSRRHLTEYWHIKAELLFGDREKIIRIIETFLSDVVSECLVSEECLKAAEALDTQICDHGLTGPFPRITYDDAIAYLQEVGENAEYGKSISDHGEGVLLDKFNNSPYWITGISREIEPFPYAIDPSNKDVTMVADLIASNRCGELVGVAEKIWEPCMLFDRLTEKGKLYDETYRFVREVHTEGCVPHIAFGMGLERLMRWLLTLPHVKYAIPFPRIVGRQIYP